MFGWFLIGLGLFLLFISLTSVIENDDTRSDVRRLSASVAFLFFYWKGYEEDPNTAFAYFLLIPVAAGSVFLMKLIGGGANFGLAWKAVAILIPFGILSILFSLIAIVSPVYKFEFSTSQSLLTGILSTGAGLFLLFPPNIGFSYLRRNKINQNNMAIQLRSPFDDTGEDSGEDAVDRMLMSIMNAGTSLAALQKTNPDLTGKIQSTFDLYNPNGGIFSSWARRIRGESRTKLLEVLNQEQKLLIEQAALFETQVREGKKQEIEFITFMAENAFRIMEVKTKAKLNAKAFAKEMLPEDWSEVRKEQEYLQIRLQEEAAGAERREAERQAEYDRAQQAEEERIRRNLESARAYKMNEDAITDDLRAKRKKVLLEIDDLEARTDISDKTKAAMKIDLDNQAENLRRRIAARERKAADDEEL